MDGEPLRPYDSMTHAKCVNMVCQTRQGSEAGRIRTVTHRGEIAEAAPKGAAESEASMAAATAYQACCNARILQIEWVRMLDEEQITSNCMTPCSSLLSH